MGNDGTISPLYCPAGDDNQAALSDYEGANRFRWSPGILRLPSSADSQQIVAAMCSDLASDNPLATEQTEQQAYELAARPNGWTYRLDVVAEDASCTR